MTTAATTTIQPEGVRGSRWVYGRELVRTADGWELTLHRFRPLAPVAGVPVMLVHGLATTGWTFFGGPGGGIAGALATAGRDTWVAELRGSQGTRSLGGSSRVRVGDKLGVDLPALIGHILRSTGSPAVDAVGHSLGGILLSLLGLGRAPRRVRRLVTLAAPLAVSPGVVPLPLRSAALERLVGAVGRIKLSALSPLVTGWMASMAAPGHFGARYIDRETFAAFMRLGVSDVHGGELEELARWVRTSDHRALLPRQFGPIREQLGSPTRFIVGAQDGLTTALAVARTRQAIGGRHSDLVVLSRKNGFSHDYRHVDILLGRDTQAEVAPLVVDWLSRGGAAKVARASA